MAGLFIPKIKFIRFKIKDIDLRLKSILPVFFVSAHGLR